LVPFQDQAAAWLPVFWPTAMQKAADVQATPLNTAAPPGLGSTDHLLPFQLSAPPLPTATQADRDTQDTPFSGLELFAGVGCTVHGAAAADAALAPNISRPAVAVSAMISFRICSPLSASQSVRLDRPSGKAP
jgi:hypothetical protein